MIYIEELLAKSVANLINVGGIGFARLFSFYAYVINTL